MRRAILEMQGGNRGMKHTVKKYHKDIYWKSYFGKAALQLLTKNEQLSLHLEEHIQNQDRKHNIDFDKLSDVLTNLYYETYNKKFTSVFEVETMDDMVVKAVIRTPYDNHYDISLVLRYGRVVTAWLNEIEDMHYTLDYTKYSTH